MLPLLLSSQRCTALGPTFDLGAAAELVCKNSTARIIRIEQGLVHLQDNTLLVGFEACQYRGRCTRLPEIQQVCVSPLYLFRHPLTSQTYLED